MHTYTPVIYSFPNKKAYDSFVSKKKHVQIIDIYKQVAFEEFINQSPSHYFCSVSEQKKRFSQYYNQLLTTHSNEYNIGSWIYHPWSNTLYHNIEQEKYYALRTSRNRDIITSSEQQILQNTHVALAGLSVGKNVLLAMLRHGIGKSYTIADSDSVAVSNFNRALYGLPDLGKSKCETTIADMYAVDPYISINAFTKGISEETLEKFIGKASLIIGAFDNFILNLSLRKLAKKKKIPIISGFDVEKGSLLIVERYDKEDIDMGLFLNSHTEEKILQSLTLEDKTDTFINIIGRKYHSPKMLKSVYNVGKTLTSYPQLVIATLLTAALFTQAAESVLLGTSTKSFRAFVPLDTFLQ